MRVWAIVLLTLDICSWSTVKMTNKLLLYILLKVGPSISNTFYDTTQFIISIQNEVLPFSKTFNSKYLAERATLQVIIINNLPVLQS